MGSMQHTCCPLLTDVRTPIEEMDMLSLNTPPTRCSGLRPLVQLAPFWAKRRGDTQALEPVAGKLLTRWPGWEQEEGLRGIQDGPCDRVRWSLRLPLHLGLPVCPGRQRAALPESWGCQHRVSPLPTPGPTAAPREQERGSPGGFPWGRLSGRCSRQAGCEPASRRERRASLEAPVGAVCWTLSPSACLAEDGVCM